MSAPLSDVVQVTITTDSAPIQSLGFGVGLLLATHKKWNDRDRSYASATEMTVDGFLTTDAAYLAAQKYFSQVPAPLTVKVGRRSVDVCKFVPVAVNNFTYFITINGTPYGTISDSSATVAEVIDAMVTAINGHITGLVATNESNTKLVLTGTTDLAYSIGVLSANLTMDTLVATAAIGADLDAIILNGDPDFYGVALVSDRGTVAAQAAAVWTSANNRVLFCQSNDANIVNVAPSSDTTSLPATLKAAAVDRACCFYDPLGTTSFIDAAVMGLTLAYQPGSYTLDLKTLIGVTVMSLTTTQRANALGKNCNVYESQGGTGRINDGRVTSGKFVDQIHGRDWMVNEDTVQVFASLANVKKVPFTDVGVGIVTQALKAAGALGVARGYIEGGTVVVTAPKVADVSAVNKGNRLLPNVTKTYREAGAIHKVQVQLIVQV